jgi:hypothetical protein
MTRTRATVYVGIALVLAAWLAAAAGLTVPTEQTAASRPQATSDTQALADDIQVQATRLRERLAAAPAPRQPSRNPFMFGERPAPAARKSAGIAPAIEPVGPPPEPPLQLVGVAEKKTDQGSVRTAMITADSDELFMLTEGETLGGRYRVKTIGEDAVELTDLVTGASRRLALR